MSTGGSVVFETRRLSIRSARTGDADIILDLWTHPKVMANVGFPQGLRVTREEIVTRIESQGESVFDQLLIVEIKNPIQAIGECNLHRPNDDGVASTDVKILPACWGNKFGVEVKQGLLDYLFTNTDCAAVEATPNVDNIASIKMQEAVGGVRIGETTYHFPESMRDYTTPVHHYIYRVYRSYWEQGSHKTG